MNKSVRILRKPLIFFLCGLKKRGISAIVATVLIILITIGGVVIVWIGVLPMVEESSIFQELDSQVSIIIDGRYTAWDSDNDVALVRVEREIDEGQVDRIRISFIVDGESVSSTFAAPISGGVQTYAFDFTGYGEPESVGVAPIFISSSGKDREGTMAPRVGMND